MLRLKVGSAHPAERAGPTRRSALRCGQVPMAQGRIGRSGDRLMVKVEEGMERQEEPEP